MPGHELETEPIVNHDETPRGQCYTLTVDACTRRREGGTEPRPEGLLGMEGAVAGTAPMSKMVSLTLTSQSRRWSSLPFETPNATLPKILDKIGSKADETGASGVPN